MARYLLVGALGGPNFGDEIILVSWINAIRQNDPQARIFCDGYNLNNLAGFLDGLAEVVEPSESLWNARLVAEHGQSEGIWDYLQEHSRLLDNQKGLSDCLSALRLRNFDQVHIVGGGYFNSLWPSNYLILLLARLLAWQTGAQLVATGLGLMPTETGNLAGLLAVLRTFDLVDVRDKESYEQLQEIEFDRLFFTGDDALLLLSDSNVRYPLQKIGDNSFIVCIQNDLFDGDSIAEAIFTSQVMTSLKLHGIWNIVFAMAMPGDVSGRAAGLVEKLKRTGFTVQSIDPDHLLKNGFPVSAGGFTVTSRYHPHLLGSLSGGRGIAISALSYYDTKHAAVRAMGSNWRILSDVEVSDTFGEALETELSGKSEPCRLQDRAEFIRRKKELADRLLKPKSSIYEFPFDFLSIWAQLLWRIQQQELQKIELKADLDGLVKQNSIIVSERDELEAHFKSGIEQIAQLKQEYVELLEQNRLASLSLIDLSKEIEAAKRLNANIINSRSWKITAPLRFLSSKLRVIRH